ncbi:MAG: hypothetical protein QOK37_2561 [Thermoanaerobaculia bacterium]|jgi:hypothetical protein|nr:hypothetical protein [Thermoanaerobaculia bacterium]
MVQDPYSTVFASVSDLDDAARFEMARLYLDNYDGSSETLFLSDLARKDEALLVYSGQQLAGFTTLKIFEREWRSQTVRVVYSGDTVVDRAHWGQQALAFDWISRMGALKRDRPDLPLYWFLLVKGHRTYRYLPLFAKSFHPHWGVERSDLKPLADALASEMFSDDYNPSTGVVEFDHSRGHLKSDIALPSPSDLDRQEVRFFLQRNPGYQRGHELVCLCEMELHNMKPLTLKLFQKERYVA